MKEIIEYILVFLAGDYKKYIGYGEEHQETKIVIIKDNRLFDNYGKEASMPQFPIKYLRDVPVLYGDNKIEKRNGKAYIYADLVSSAYFMMSGYEEIVYSSVKDEWGRFPGKQSLAFKIGSLDRPIVDEYRCLLFDILNELGENVQTVDNKINKVYLTHDVDQPWQQYTFSQAVKKSLYNLIKLHKFDISAIKEYFGIYCEEYLETFRFFGEQDQKIQRVYLNDCQCIYFILGNNKKQNMTYSYINDSKFKVVLNEIRKNDVIIGIHSSPLANEKIEVLEEEKGRIEKHIGEKITKIRNHCLLVRQSDEMEQLLSIGISKDFSGGYADVAGFRYGTSKAFFYINPYTRKLTELVLQPLIIMDGSLNDERYMNMSYEDALYQVKKIIDNVKKNNGDLNILWHNHMCDNEGCTYHRKLYREIINYIVALGVNYESD